jgi:hypothetical protein
MEAWSGAMVNGNGNGERLIAMVGNSIINKDAELPLSNVA